MHWLDDEAAWAAAGARAAATARGWLAGDERTALTARFDAVPAGDADAAADEAAALLSGTDWVAALLAPLIERLAGDPRFEPPLRVQRDTLRTGALLFDHPAVSITAAVLSADALAATPAPRTLVVPGRLSVIRLHRAGGARLLAWEAPSGADPALACRRLPDVALADGQVLRWDGRRRAMRFAGADADVVSLTATIRYAAAATMREYRADTGAFVREATLDAAASRTAMLLTLLRLSGRHDAGDAFAVATRSPAFHLRWAAMRDWLAVDVAAALPRLRSMAASDPDPGVRAAARSTLGLAEARLAA